MKMRMIFTILILLLCCAEITYTQDCGDCGKRSITIYNFEISLNTAVTDHDSILNIYNSLKATPKVVDYLNNIDPTRECIVTQEDCPAARFLDTARALSDPSILSMLAEWPSHTPTVEFPDYYIIGTVAPVSAQGIEYIFVHFFLLAGPQQKEVTVGYAPLDYYPAGNIDETIARAMTEKFGNARDKIRDFEVEARDLGAPYAIQPTLTVTAGKNALDFNETTTVTFSLKDCDGVALGNRVITISDVVGGTVNQISLTTDSNGEATLQYTAGTTPGLGSIVPSFAYTRPCDKPGNMNIKPVFIEIKRPADSWLVGVDYTYTESRKYSYNDIVGETKTGISNITENIFFATWVKAYPLPYPLPGYFVSDPNLIDIKTGGNRNETGQFNRFWSNSAGYIRDNIWTDIYARNGLTDTAGLNIHITYDRYHFSFGDMPAIQRGGEHRLYEQWDIIGGTYTENTMLSRRLHGLSFLQHR